MTEWKEVALGDVADILVGYAYKSAQFSEQQTDTRLLRGVNIGQGSLDWGRTAWWPDPDPDSRYQLADGDVVLAMDRPWIEAGLKRARIRDKDLPALLVQRVARLRGTTRARTSFIHHLTATERFSQYLQNIVTGATVPHISQSQIEAFPIRVPSLQEQDQICDVLDSIDDLIEKNRRRVEVLEEMARAVYREWFVHFRYPGHEDVPLVDSPLGPIPDGWEVQPFSELASFVNGFAFKPAHWGDSGRPIIKIKQLKQGVTPDTPRCDPDSVAAKYWIEPGDLLFSWSADLGVYRWSDEPGLLNQHLFVVTPDERSSVAFLHHALDRAMPQFWDRAQGTTMRHIKRSALSEVTTGLPPHGLIRRFTEVVDPIDHEASVLGQEIRNLAGLRDLLLPKLVTGQIDVSRLDLDELVEVASA